jgi:hypothetical protein
MTATRRLAAILPVDFVGYSCVDGRGRRLVSGTIARRSAFRVRLGSI